MRSSINDSTMYQFMAVSVGNMTNHLGCYVVLVAGKKDFTVIMATSILVCLLGIVVLVIVLIVKVRKQRVSRLPWRN
jgi:hypothetical protein